jgi:hypothetical protein
MHVWALSLGWFIIGFGGAVLVTYLALRRR